jgi:hypothetical protein
VPSLAAGSSYARLSATDNGCFVMNFASFYLALCVVSNS